MLLPPTKLLDPFPFLPEKFFKFLARRHEEYDMDDFSIALLGISRASNDFNLAAARLSRTTLPSSDSPCDEIDLSAEIVALLRARSDFQANVKSAQALDQTTKALLSLLP